LILISRPIITRTHAFIVACEPKRTKNKENPRTFHVATSDVDGDNDDDDNNNKNNNNNNNNHNYHSSTPEKIQQYTDMKEELISTYIWQLKTVYLVPQVLLTTGVIPNKLHGSLKLLNLRPTLYILMLLAAVLNACCIVRKFLEKQ
jgi:hypothetical protein